MRKAFLLALLAALVLCHGVFAAENKDAEKKQAETGAAAEKIIHEVEKVEPQEVKKEILTRLPNGLLVYIIKDTRFPLVCSRLYVRAGSAMEEAGQAGISHVLEHMVFKGTSHRPKGEVARDVEALGGYLNAATSFDKTWYITDMPAQHWKTGMDVLKDMAFQATLDPAELESEKNVVISELQRGEDSPMRKLFENMQVAALKNTAYGRPIIGYEDTIRKLTVADLKAYVAKWYQPQNMMLLVCGDIVPDEVLAHAAELFGSLKNTSDLNVVEPFDVATAANGSEKVQVERGPWSKVYFGLTLPAPALANLKSVDLDVLCYLLGGDGTSTFYQKYKYEKQLVDSIDVSNMSLARAGMLSITATLDADKLETFWNELSVDLARLSGSLFDNDAIVRARFNLEDSMDRAGETLNGLAAWKGSLQFDLGGETGEKNIRFAQRNVGKTQLDESIADWFVPSRARIRILAGKDAAIPDIAGILEKNWPAAQSVPEQEVAGVKNTPQIVNFDNNCKLILLPDDSAPYVAMDFIMSGGNSLLAEDQQGLANLAARLLSDGCGSMSRAVLERWLAERATSLGARSGMQTFSISIDGPSRFLTDIFGLLRDVLRKPKFDSADFQREVNDMKSAIKQRNDRPLSYMFSKIYPFLFPRGQVYGYDSLGDIKMLDSFNVLSVRDFWARQSGQPWILAVSGSYNLDDVLKFAKDLPAPRGKEVEVPQPEWNMAQKELGLTLPGRNQAHLMRIFPTVPMRNDDTPGLMLLESVLSGQSGLLFSELRDDQGLGYTVTAFNRSMPEAGFMAFYIGTTTDKMDKAREGFDKIIERLKKEALPEETLRAGANRLLGEYLRGRQSLASRASDAATNAILKYPPEFEKTLIEKAATLTPEDVRAIANKYLNNPYEVTLLP